MVKSGNMCILFLLELITSKCNKSALSLQINHISLLLNFLGNTSVDIMTWKNKSCKNRWRQRADSGKDLFTTKVRK